MFTDDCSLLQQDLDKLHAWSIDNNTSKEVQLNVIEKSMDLLLQDQIN